MLLRTRIVRHTLNVGWAAKVHMGRVHGMTCARLRNIDRFIDRHGKPRHYHRVGKGRRVRLPGEPGSAEFMQAYAAALAALQGSAEHGSKSDGVEHVVRPRELEDDD